MRSRLRQLTSWFYASNSTNANATPSTALINSTSSSYGSIEIDVMDEKSEAASHKAILEKIAKESRLRTIIYRNDQRYRSWLMLLALLGVSGGAVWTFKIIFDYSNYTDDRITDIRDSYSNKCPADDAIFSGFDPICWHDPEDGVECDDFAPNRYCEAVESVRANFNLLSENCFALLNLMCLERSQFSDENNNAINKFLFDCAISVFITALSLYTLRSLRHRTIVKVTQAELDEMKDLRSAQLVHPRKKKAETSRLLNKTVYETVEQELKGLRRNDYLTEVRTQLLRTTNAVSIIDIICAYLCTFDLAMDEVNAALMLLRCDQSQIPGSQLAENKNANNRYRFLPPSERCIYPGEIFDEVMDFIEKDGCGLMLMDLPYVKKRAVLSNQALSLDEDDQDLETLAEIKKVIEEAEMGENAMYIRLGLRSNKYLIYVNKARDEFINIKLKPKQFSDFDKVLELKYIPQKLDHAQLMRIQELTAHDHFIAAPEVEQASSALRLA